MKFGGNFLPIQFCLVCFIEDAPDRLSIGGQILQAECQSLLLLTMTGLSVPSIVKMQQINANAVEIQSSWLPRVRALAELRTSGIFWRKAARQLNRLEPAVT
jgi:hypothetical protein